MERPSFFSSLVELDDGVYYMKYASIIDELIGSFLAKKIKLDSVDYQIGIYKDNIYALSKLFYNRDYEYFYPKDYQKFKMNNSSKTHPNLITDIYCFRCKLKQFDENLTNELLKLIALDLKMGQVDRHGHNLMFKKDIKTGVVDLAPIYDYSYGYPVFGVPFKYYKNVYIFIRTNYLSMMKLVRKFPQIMEYIDILKEIDMEEILEAIETEKNIKIEPDERKFRIDRDKEYTKKLKII